LPGSLLAAADISLLLLPLGQPLAELPLVCEKLQPQVLVLFSNHRPGADFSRQMSRLALAVECPLALAGEVAEMLDEQVAGSPVACLGSDARTLQRRLQQLLEGHLDT
jgi:MerR family transcriptional regulator, light-induced transcriptional regulator